MRARVVMLAYVRISVQRKCLKMAKSNLYTRTGDSGETSLVGGERVKKWCSRLEAYGTLDEFSSFLGVVLSSPSCPRKLHDQLLEVQNELFNLGSYLATSPAEGTSPTCGLTDEKLKEIETWIYTLDEDTPRIRAFVLPGGCELAAHVHVARTVCRRAERRIYSMREEENCFVDPKLLSYLNRLSDYLFIAARWLNCQAGVEEIIWRR